MTGRAVPVAIAIVGPTATGKTSLATEVARRLDGEVISVDSRQAYRGMRVGTAAATEETMGGVPHHGVGILGPEETYAAGRFARLARGWIYQIRDRGRVPILAGGTGFFLEALLCPVFREPEMSEERRLQLRQWLEQQPEDRLRRWVKRLDPSLSQRLPVVDRQRAARTLELALLSGRPVTWWQDHGQPDAPPLEALSYLLTLPSGDQRERIERRALRLLKSGWREEVQRLLDEGYEGAPAWNAVGYREVAAWVRGEIDRQAALEGVVRATWGYARRQRTWYRNRLPNATRLDGREPSGEVASRITAEWHASQMPAGESVEADRGKARD